MTKLQNQFADLKRKNFENRTEWCKKLTEHLLEVESMYSDPPELTKEHDQFRDTFDIPFKTDKYRKWVR